LYVDRQQRKELEALRAKTFLEYARTLADDIKAASERIKELRNGPYGQMEVKTPQQGGGTLVRRLDTQREYMDHWATREMAATRLFGADLRPKANNTAVQVINDFSCKGTLRPEGTHSTLNEISIVRQDCSQESPQPSELRPHEPLLPELEPAQDPVTAACAEPDL
jgi:hypothetical protein